MTWRPVALSAGSIVLVGLIWRFAEAPLEWIGLGDFDPLTRICLVVLVLSLVDKALARLQSH